jgi:hypothetical protein
MRGEAENPGSTISRAPTSLNSSAAPANVGSPLEDRRQHDAFEPVERAGFWDG